MLVLEKKDVGSERLWTMLMAVQQNFTTLLLHGYRTEEGHLVPSWCISLTLKLGLTLPLTFLCVDVWRPSFNFKYAIPL